MKVYSLIFILLTACTSICAQIVPGYQGKKTIVSYQTNVSPAFDRPTFLNRARHVDNYPKAKASLFVPFNFSHGLTIERVLGRQFSLEMDYNFAASKDYVNFTQTIRDNVTNVDKQVQFRDVKLNMYGHYFTGCAVFYGNNSLAPFGSYFKFSIGRCMMYTQFVDETITSEPTGLLTQGTDHTFDTKKMYYGLTTMHFGLGFGSNRIYRNKWVVSKGVNFSYLFEPEYSTFDIENTHDKTYKRIKAHDILTIFVKIGYLL